MRGRGLLWANSAFVVAMLLHTADHFRQARGVLGVPPDVILGGSAIFVLAFASLWLTARHSPQAALIATALGFAAAVGVTASHIAPTWGPLSDSYLELGLDGYSWAVMLLEVGTGFVLGAVGWRSLTHVQNAVAT